MRRALIYLSIVIPLLAVAVFSYFQMRQRAIDRIYEDSRAIAALNARILKERLDRVRDIGISYSTRVLLAQSVEAHKWDDALELVAAIPGNFSYVHRVFLADTSGNLMADVPSSPASRGVNYSHRDWFRGFIATGRPYLSEAYRRSGPPREVVSALAVPINNKASELVGILVLQVNMEKLIEWNRNVRIGGSGLVYIVDHKGHIVLNPKYAGADTIVDYSSAEVVKKVLSGKKNVEILYDAIEKEVRLVAYEQIPEFGWGVMVTQELSAALATAGGLNDIVVIYAVAVIFSLGFGYMITREMALRKKAETELKKSNELFFDLFEFNPAGIVISRLSDHVVLDVNRAYQDLFGFATKAEIIGKSTDGMNQVDPRTRADILESVKEKKTVRYHEMAGFKKDGSSFWMSATVKRIDLDGTPCLFEVINDITERKKVQEALAESEDKFRKIINFSPVGITVTTAEGRIVETNAAIREIIGLHSREEHLRTSAADHYVDPADRQKMLDQFKKQGFVRNYELRLKKTSGEQVWVSNSMTPIRLGEKDMLLSTTLDITQLKKAEEHLTQYMHFFNNSNDLCVIANMDGFFETVNPKVGKVLGYSNEEWRARPFLEFVHPDDLAAVVRAFESQTASGTVVTNFVCRFRQASGDYSWIEWNSIPNVSTGKIYAIGRDITKRMELENELRATSLKLNEAQALAHVGNWEVNLLSGRSTWSDEAYRILGLDKNEVIPSPESFLSTIHPEDLDFVRERVNGAFKSAHRVPFNYRVRRKGGTIVHILSQTNLEFDDHGTPVRFFGIIHDITEIKKAEEELVAANRELEAFTYSVSHDLRAPLRSVNSFAKILQEDHLGKLDGEAANSLAVIIRNSKKMGDLIDDLLAFSRLGRKEIVTSSINMVSLVRSVVDEVAPADSDRIEFKFNQLLPASADHALLRQVWINLISNAVKYSGHKLKAVIEIGSYAEENQNVYYVKDNGAGFDMRYYDKLFGVFQRLHSQEEFEGTGIGLAIVHKIIVRHKGTVWAESKVNEGSCFYFSLPKY